MTLASQTTPQASANAQAQRRIPIKRPDPSVHERHPDEILVKFKPGVTDSQAQSALERNGARKVGEIRSLGIKKAKVAPGLTPEDAAARIQADPSVDYAEPIFRRRALEIPNDPYYGAQWGLYRMRCEQAWSVTKGLGETIAVVDTGVDYSHPDLTSKVTLGYDFVNDDADPMDDEGHGTHVAGIAAAATNNGIGVAGVGWNARILAVKVLDAYGSGWDDDVAAGIAYAADNGASVVNLSLGGLDRSRALDDAVAYARSKGAAVVAAAGNSGGNNVFYPAGSPGAVGVAATALNGVTEERAWFSTYGTTVDLSAPGSDIFSTYPASFTGGDNPYVWASGTSMSAPAVSGAIALAKAKNTSKSGDQIARLLMVTATDMGSSGWDKYYGYGKVDAFKAVSVLMNSVEESDAGTSYSGSWSSSVAKGASGSLHRTSNTASSVATFRFVGTEVVWIARKGPSEGIASVNLDGASLGSVDLYSSESRWQALVLRKTGLAQGAHTLRITVTGERNQSSTGSNVSIDAFDFVGFVDATPPSAPADLSASRDGATVNLVWSASSDDVGVAYYSVERAPATGGPWIARGTSRSLSYNEAISPAEQGKTWFYRVRALDAAGNPSSYSNVVSVEVPDLTPPSAPGSIRRSRSGSSVTLSWTVSTDNVGVNLYRVERSTDGLSWIDMGEAASPATSYVDSSSPGSERSPAFYRVRAVDEAGNASDYSDVASTALPRMDFNGDGKSDAAAVYGKVGSADLWIFRSSWTTANSAGVTFSAEKWRDIPGFDPSHMKTVAGDFNGDGRADVAALYDYGRATSSIWLFESTGSAFSPPKRVFSSTAWAASKAKLSAGDFDGDGKDEIIAFYGYGGSTTGVFFFDFLADGRATPRLVYLTPSWDWKNTKLVTVAGGDKDRVTAVYDYGRGVTGIWSFSLNQESGQGARVSMQRSLTLRRWGARNSTFTGADIDGDGYGELIAFYNYGSARTGVFTLQQRPDGSFSQPGAPLMLNRWSYEASVFVAGDYQGDGKGDASAVYSYGRANAGFWLLFSQNDRLTSPVSAGSITQWNNAATRWIH